MTKATWIYPQWYRATRELKEELGLDSYQRDALDAWFKKHVFEFGQDYHIGLKNRHAEVEIIKYAKLNCLRSLSEHIYKKGMVLEQQTEDYLSGGKTLRMTMLVCGVPNDVGQEERNEP